MSLTAIGCSGSNSGSGTASGSVLNGDGSAFCAKAKEIQASPPGNDPSAIAAAFAQLDAVAPTAEVRSALQSLRSALDRLETAMPTGGSGSGGDMAGFEELMKLATDPDFINASATLSAYAMKECGIDIDTGLNTGDSVPPAGDSAASGPNIFDDIETREFGEVVDPYLLKNAPQYRIASILMSEQPDYASIEIGITGSGALDAVALCNEVDAYVVANTEDRAYAISIFEDASKAPLAGRKPGQPCSAG